MIKFLARKWVANFWAPKWLVDYAETPTIYEVLDCNLNVYNPETVAYMSLSTAATLEKILEKLESIDNKL